MTDAASSILHVVPSQRHWHTRKARRLFSESRSRAKPDDIQLAATQEFGVIPQADFMQIKGQKVMLALGGTENFLHANADDFIISLRTFEGGIERCRSSGCVSPAYTVLKPSHDVDARFFTYLLKSTWFISVIQSCTTGIRDGKTITYSQFASLELPLPSLLEQRGIADFLDRETAEADALVAKYERLIAILEEKRVALITQAVTKGLNLTVPMKGSGVEWIGDIPARWNCGPFRRYVKRLQYGATESGERDLIGAPRYIRITDIDSSGQLRSDDRRFLPQHIAAPYMLNDGDVLFARSGATVGKAFLYSSDLGSACFAGYMIRAQLTKELNPRFLCYFSSSASYWAYIKAAQSQATIENVNASVYGGMPLPIPPIDEQKSIVANLDRATGSIENLIAKARKAVALTRERRAAVTSAAVTGSLDAHGTSLVTHTGEKVTVLKKARG